MTLASNSDTLLRPEGLAKEGTTLASDSNPLLRPEGLAKEGRRSLPTSTRFSDRKAWPRGQRSLLTLTRFFNREYTEPLPVALL